MSSTWSSGIGKFHKKDPDHGKWWKKIKKWAEAFRHWCCKTGLCRIDICKCVCHKKDTHSKCKNSSCGCKKS